MEPLSTEQVVDLWSGGDASLEDLASHVIWELLCDWFDVQWEEGEADGLMLRETAAGVRLNAEVTVGIENYLPALLQAITVQMQWAIVEMYPGGPADYQQLVSWMRSNLAAQTDLNSSK